MPVSAIPGTEASRSEARSARSTAPSGVAAIAMVPPSANSATRSPATSTPFIPDKSAHDVVPESTQEPDLLAGTGRYPASDVGPAGAAVHPYGIVVANLIGG